MGKLLLPICSIVLVPEMISELVCKIHDIVDNIALTSIAVSFL